MNIKIPYKFLGNFGEMDFLSFILDKEGKSIYRKDINQKDSPDVFSRKQEFLQVDDSIYNSCDTIVFFPFLKNKGWGERVVIKKESQEFLKLNGGIEYIKNSEKAGDGNLLKEWLKRGLDIEYTDNIIGSKNLIYFSVFGSEYVSLLKLLLKGLKKQSYQNFDILFITDRPTKLLVSKIPSLKKINHDYMIVKKITDPVIASMQKLKIFEYKNVNDYQRILFLDLDILVLGNIEPIFSKKIYPNKLYSATHRYSQDLHNTCYNTVHDYSKIQLHRFDKMNIFPFNAGQFLFLNTNTMRDHFKNIQEFTTLWDGKFFFEQSFMNTYFNTLQISDMFRFKDEFNFIVINTDDVEYRPNPDSIFVHFMGNVANAGGKLQFIKTNYKHLLP